MKAAIYLRVSTDRQTTENQEPDVRQVLKARRVKTWARFEEQASAAKHRPAFEAMMAAARRGEFQLLVVWALDRFGRSMFGNVRDVLELDRLGVRVLSVKESWLDTDGPVRQLLIAIFSWVAEQERARLIERTMAGLERARRQGKHLGRPATAPVLLANARELIAKGSSIKGAARGAGVSEGALRRHLASRKVGTSSRE